MMGLNPRDVAKAMKRMGIQQQDINATEVIIKLPDKEIIITNPSVAKVNMMGQESYQITGEEHERNTTTEPEISDEDIKTVMEQTGANEKTAKEAIKNAKGDLAQAIIDLKNE